MADSDLNLALTLARRGGALAAAAFAAQSFDVSEKPGDLGPVTSADREVNQLLVDGLRAARPSDAIVAEESDLQHQRAARTWFVDPIDGTREFVAGRPEFSVMLGLVVDGEPTVGVVYDPSTDLLYAGARGQGAWAIAADGTRRAMRVGQTRDVRHARMIRSRSHPSRAVDRVCDLLGIHDTRPLGSIGLKLAAIAGDRADLYLNLAGRSALWDAAAPHALLEAAGGRVSDRHGRPIDYAGDELFLVHGLVASNGPLHAPLLEAIAALPPEAP